jgi:hypothetical protein
MNTRGSLFDKRAIRRILTPAILATAALAVAGPALAASTYQVSTVAQLQTAVDAVNAGPGGDTIVMAPGFYAITSQLRIDQDVTIQGDPLAPTVVDGGGLVTILRVIANNFSIQNVTLQQGSPAISYEGRGVFLGTGVTITGSNTGFSPGDSGGTTFFTNSTIANNTGHGIEISCAALHLTNVTVSGNDVGVYFGYPCGEVMQITNSLIVGNGLDCGGGGSFVLAGLASIDQDSSCETMAIARGGGGFTTGNPALGALASNGGPTMTEAIPATTIARDAGNNAQCPATDQRGFVRADGACDIGAYEFGAAAGGSNTSPGTNVSVSPAPGVSVTFSQVDVAGDTTATTGGPLPPSGFQVDGVVYDISTTAVFSGSVTICLPYSPAIDPNPRLNHFEGGVWVNRTSSVDHTNHIVCGTVSSLSPFAVLTRTNVSGELQALQTLVNSFNLRKPAARKFNHRLDAARKALAKGHHKKFCKELDAFLRDVQKQSGKSLTASEADQLRTLAEQIASKAGCV